MLTPGDLDLDEIVKKFGHDLQIVNPTAPDYGIYDRLALEENVFQTRILTLLPGNRGDPLRCRLRKVVINAKASYEALSYTWGSNEKPHAILINDLPSHITRNLNDALCALRWPRRKRKLWIDAMCINQGDAMERAQQVAEMGNIYRNAYKVIIWLGTGNKLTDVAIALMHDCVWPGDGPRRNDYVAGLKDILSRKWFTRVWVVQELCMGAADPFLICGNSSISWSAFIRILVNSGHEILSTLRDHQDLDSHMAKVGHALQMNDMRARVQRPPRLRSFTMVNDDYSLLEDDLLLWLQRTAMFEASDPRDKLYALLGLTRSILWRQVQVDYNAPTVAIMHSLTLRHIRAHKSLDLLTLCHPGHSFLLASWLPDLTVPGLPDLPHMLKDVPTFSTAPSPESDGGMLWRRDNLDPYTWALGLLLPLSSQEWPDIEELKRLRSDRYWHSQSRWTTGPMTLAASPSDWQKLHTLFHRSMSLSKDFALEDKSNLYSWMEQFSQVMRANSFNSVHTRICNLRMLAKRIDRCLLGAEAVIVSDMGNTLELEGLRLGAAQLDALTVILDPLAHAHCETLGRLHPCNRQIAHDEQTEKVLRVCDQLVLEDVSDITIWKLRLLARSLVATKQRITSSLARIYEQQIRDDGRLERQYRDVFRENEPTVAGKLALENDLKYLEQCQLFCDIAQPLVIQHLQWAPLWSLLLVNHHQQSVEDDHTARREELLQYTRYFRKRDVMPLQRATKGRVRFRTDTGLLGLGPPDLHDRDQIVMLGNCRTAFAIRPGAAQSWTLVGPVTVCPPMSFVFDDEQGLRYEDWRKKWIFLQRETFILG